MDERFPGTCYELPLDSNAVANPQCLVSTVLSEQVYI
jgi:hypothetical protein